MKNLYQNLSDNNKGILWIIITCLLVSMMISIARYLSKEVHVFQIVMMRNFFALLFFIPLIIKNKKRILQTSKLKLHFARAITGLFSMLLWFYTITLIPLPEAVAVTFIVPIFTTIAAAIFLKEKINKQVWLALFFGFIGILIIAKPEFGEFKLAYVLALITTLLWAASNIFVKKMTKTEKPETIVFYVSSIMFLLSVPIAAPYLKPMNFKVLFWLALMGGIANLSHISMSIAYSKSDLSVLQPFDFSRLVFVSIIAYFVFGEILDETTIIGSAVIMASSLYMTSKKKYRKKQKLPINAE